MARTGGAGEKRTRRHALGSLTLAAAALLVASSVASDANELVAEVRVFEIRRLSSDFTPMEGLAFRLDSDGVRVPVSDWLATLARRVPEGYFAQLLTLGPLPATPGETWEAATEGDRRSVRVRLSPAASGEDAFTAELALLGASGEAMTARREGMVEPGMTLVVSGRDFEITPSDYLSWFRAPPDIEARGRLYEHLRDHSIFLALAITFREAGERDTKEPVQLAPPAEPRLLALTTSLVGPTEGEIRLRVELDEDGAPIHTDVIATTFPEVTPRVLGIVSGWRFPEAAGRIGLLTLRVASVPPAASPDRSPDRR